MTRTPGPIRIAALLVLATLIAGACGGGRIGSPAAFGTASDGRSVAVGQGPEPTPAGSSDTSASPLSSDPAPIVPTQAATPPTGTSGSGSPRPSIAAPTPDPDATLLQRIDASLSELNGSIDDVTTASKQGE